MYWIFGFSASLHHLAMTCPLYGVFCDEKSINRGHLHHGKTHAATFLFSGVTVNSFYFAMPPETILTLTCLNKY